MSGATAWADAVRALALFAVDPLGLAGIAVRAPAGPVRDHFLTLLRDALPPGMRVHRLPAHTGDDRLLGGLDLAATLQAGRLVAQKGLLAEADGGWSCSPWQSGSSPGSRRGCVRRSTTER